LEALGVPKEQGLSYVDSLISGNIPKGPLNEEIIKAVTDYKNGLASEVEKSSGAASTELGRQLDTLSKSVGSASGELAPQVTQDIQAAKAAFDKKSEQLY